MGAGVTRGDDIRRAVRDLNHGYCMLGCGRSASNYAHRLRESAGGPVTTWNGLGLCGSGAHGCHRRTDDRRDLAVACGWQVNRGCDPLTVPALVEVGGVAGWWLPDGDGGWGLHYSFAATR